MESKLGVTGGRVAQRFKLREHLRGSVHLHSRVMFRVEGELVLGEVPEDEHEGSWDDWIRVNYWYRTGSTRERSSQRAAVGWLFQTVGGEQTTVRVRDMVSVQTFERSPGLVELGWVHVEATVAAAGGWSWVG